MSSATCCISFFSEPVTSFLMAIILFAILELGFLLIISSSLQPLYFSSRPCQSKVLTCSDKRFSLVIKTGDGQFSLRVKLCPFQLLFLYIQVIFMLTRTVCSIPFKQKCRAGADERAYGIVTHRCRWTVVGVVRTLVHI